jgi:hypothetical protein
MSVEEMSQRVLCMNSDCAQSHVKHGKTWGEMCKAHLPFCVDELDSLAACPCNLLLDLGRS